MYLIIVFLIDHVEQKSESQPMVIWGSSGVLHSDLISSALIKEPEKINASFLLHIFSCMLCC